MPASVLRVLLREVVLPVRYVCDVARRLSTTNYSEDEILLNDFLINLFFAIAA